MVPHRETLQVLLPVAINIKVLEKTKKEVGIDIGDRKVDCTFPQVLKVDSKSFQGISVVQANGKEILLLESRIQVSILDKVDLNVLDEVNIIENQEVVGNDGNAKVINLNNNLLRKEENFQINDIDTEETLDIIFKTEVFTDV